MFISYSPWCAFRIVWRMGLPHVEPVVDCKESASFVLLPGPVPPSREQQDCSRWWACESSREVAEEV